MNRLETRKFNMLTRVRDFGITHASSFPTNSLGGELFTALAEIVQRLEDFASEKSSSTREARQSTATKTLARETLKEWVEAIQRTARAIAVHTPGIEEKFRLQSHCTDQQLISSARAFAADAFPLKAEFIRHEMAANFITELNTAIEEFDRATSDRNHSSEARFTAIASLGATLGQGLTVVLQLDAIVRNKFKSDRILTATWIQATKVERPARTTRAPREQPIPPQPGIVQ